MAFGEEIPLWIEYVTLCANSEQFISICDGVKVGILAIQEKCIWFPNVLQPGKKKEHEQKENFKEINSRCYQKLDCLGG